MAEENGRAKAHYQFCVPLSHHLKSVAAVPCLNVQLHAQLFIHYQLDYSTVALVVPISNITSTVV